MKRKVSNLLGARVRRARERMGWTQAKLAKAIGVKPEYISHIELGRRIPAVQRVERIASALDLPKEELLLAAIAHRYPQVTPYLTGVKETPARETVVRRFKVILEKDFESGLWVTYVPSFGHLSTYGQSKREALLQTREAILAYLEAARQEGLDVPAGDLPLEVVDLEVPVS